MTILGKHATIGLGEEAVPAGEEAGITRLVEQNLELLDERKRPVRRGQHPKHHGCVRAAFSVEPGLPAELSHGLFAHSRSYPALIRFSNGAAFDDRKGDAHGMAIKLFDVPGEKLLEPCQTHDFVLLDHPVFFIRNVADYVALFDAVLSARSSVLPSVLFFLPHEWVEQGLVFVRLLSTHPHELAVLQQLISKRPKSLLNIHYWSTTAYRLGPHAVKWMMRPLSPRPPLGNEDDSPDTLRHALVSELRGEAAFEFMAQVQTNAETMPIEDPTVEWDEKEAPWRRVATLRMPSQTFDTPALMEFCQGLSFNPWRCIEAHRPLGGINRARRAIYRAVSRRRRALNGTPRAEPTVQAYTAVHGNA